MKRRSFLKWDTAPILGGALAACGGNDHDPVSSPGSNSGGDPGSVPAGPPPHENTVSTWTQAACRRFAPPGPARRWRRVPSHSVGARAFARARSLWQGKT